MTLARRVCGICCCCVELGYYANYLRYSNDSWDASGHFFTAGRLVQLGYITDLVSRLVDLVVRVYGVL
jgi:hypothetical protein